MKRALLSLMLVLVLSLGVMLAGCGKAEEENPNTAGNENAVEEPTDVNEPEVVVEPAKPYTFPLTGIGSDTEVKTRPIVVMVENQAKARPQDGLHKADIVYEILAEGEITRFVAVFQSQTADVIGPVRSIRPYFAQIGHGFDALIVHAGWSQDAMNYIAKYKLAHFDQVYGDDKYYWRDKSRKAPHNLYTKTDLIREGAVKKKFSEEWNEAKPSFYPQGAEIPAIVGEPAATVKIPYIQGYNVGYEYDATTNKYKRIMMGEPHTDKTTGTQITADNVMVLFSKHKILDNAGRRAVDVVGPGDGYLIQMGQLRKITWERKDGMIRPFIDGQEVPLLPGQTWVQIVPEGSKVEYQ